MTCLLDHVMYLLENATALAERRRVYIGGRGFVLCQFIDSVTFARCAFIFAIQNITLGGYLDIHRNIYGTTYGLKRIKLENATVLSERRRPHTVLHNVQNFKLFPNVTFELQ